MLNKLLSSKDLSAAFRHLPLPTLALQTARIMLHPTFQKELPKVIELLKRHKIKSAYAFGSVVNGKFNNDSDVDLLVNLEEGLDPVDAGEHLWTLQDELRDLFNREIDLVTERSLRNPYFIKELNETRLPIYG